jgi:hypothetical protein
LIFHFSFILFIILDQINEAMKAKRLPSINEQLDSQISLLEEMVNSFGSKWKIFIEDKTYNSIDKSKELNNNIFKHFDINLKSKKNNILFLKKEYDKYIKYKKVNNNHYYYQNFKLIHT